ncbi:Vomeronasal type-1 receptor 1 [Heterocephalus glaber]|uniref:Vomeronasal type-1 receptor n=1 Tax=Heterocephalus glaber TaxID=10181 RepID=G5CAV4_HETGA|nr:Vomeronasal type-1 receptor 1 [Heterocephalus glaber]
MAHLGEALGAAWDTALETIFLLQFGAGTLANVALFFHNIYPHPDGPKLRPMQVIFAHMAVANSLLLLSMGIPHSRKSDVRREGPEALGPVCGTCWTLGILANVHIPVKITGPQDADNNSGTQAQCAYSGSIAGTGFLRFAHDAMFVGLVAWSSGSMVLLLHRHRQ